MGMTRIKNAQELKDMRESCRLLALILHELEAYLEPGMSTMDLEHKAEELFARYQALPGFKGYHGFPNILCTSVNDEVVHAIPNKHPMNKGDILSIDCGVIVNGMNSDSAIAMVVGGETTPVAQALVDTCIKALWTGVKQVKAHCHIGDIGHAIQNVVEDAGFHIIKELTGHGIGYNLHERPYILNYGERGEGEELLAGMTIAIEPIISAGNPSIETLDDDWTIVTRDHSLSIQHEHTILVTENGCEVLTLRPGEKVL
jgi:methionyl aminopeptidase